LTNNIDNVLKEAHILVEPISEDVKRLRKIARLVLDKVRKSSMNESSVQSVELGGSYAKGTWLKDKDVDIDVFVKFAKDISKSSLEKIGIRIGQNALSSYPQSLRYSEHPYVEGLVDNVKVNVVPCYNVRSGNWLSAADRSPYHTKLINSSFNDDLKREARLLKKFTKSIGVYGSDIKTQGFSGYLCEVLVLRYGSLKSTLEAIAAIKENSAIFINDVDTESLKKFNTPLIILDPVDNNRNLGAAVSHEKASNFIMASRAFIQSPSIDFFKGRKKKSEISDLENSPLIENLIVAIFNHKPRTVDILWGQLKRSERHLTDQLAKIGFKVLKSRSASNEKSTSGLIFLLDSLVISRNQIKVGPKVDMVNETSTFIRKNQKQSKLIWTSQDLRINILVERKYWRSEDTLRALLDGGISNSGVAPGMKSEIEGCFEIYVGRDILNIINNKEWLLKELIDVVTTDRFVFGSY